MEENPGPTPGVRGRNQGRPRWCPASGAGTLEA